MKYRMLEQFIKGQNHEYLEEFIKSFKTGRDYRNLLKAFVGLKTEVVMDKGIDSQITSRSGQVLPMSEDIKESDLIANDDWIVANVEKGGVWDIHASFNVNDIVRVEYHTTGTLIIHI